MESFKLLSSPWWVNLFILAPIAAWFFWRGSLFIAKRTLLLTAIFGAAFGFVESSVVVYLRGAIGLLAECKTKLPNGMISVETYRQSHLLDEIPRYFLTIEMYREAATVVMLLTIAMLAVAKFKEQSAIFLWAFAFWDIFYYIGLKISIGWPQAFTTSDVLFLLPVPWLSQVWFPILISSLFILVIIYSRKD